MNDIKIINLTKKYKDVTAVNNINLEIKSGELFALLGVNGAGKTTLIKILSCLSKPTSGEAFLGGFSVVSNPINVKHIIAISPQETAIAPNLTIKENMEFICEIYNFTKEQTKEKIFDISSKLSLTNVLNKKVNKLSGGYQRRVSIALGLISNPSILFLDEPTLGLDVISRQELWDIINKLKGKITIVLTTHYLAEAENLADRIGIMNNGNLLFVGNKKQMMELTNVNTFEEAFISIVKGEKI